MINYDREKRPFPFGLGYHPYFATTPDCRIQTPAQARWELVDGLPTGRRLPVAGDFDLREPKPVSNLTLDDVYTDLPNVPAGPARLIERGRVEYPGLGVLRIRTEPAFRELVLFTPPHRKAVCLEPYTCPTDAIHLQEREDVGCARTAARRKVGRNSGICVGNRLAATRRLCGVERDRGIALRSAKPPRRG